jgi:hypothetical protein
VEWRKLCGVAGLLGVVAGGVLIAREQRSRAAYTPEEIRARLRDRLAGAQDGT